MATQLAEVRERLQAGVPLGEADRALLAIVLEDVARQRRPALAARLRQASLHQRNELIWQLGQRFFRSGSLRARARALLAEARLYRDGQWQHHRALAAPPDVIAGTARELMWRAFKAHQPFPFGTRTIEGLIR